ncbi:hypothetical protein [Methylomonas sp. AM2-LC]|uniref:hypothetical protein n=1 Tax=Methylomonas sp. AM2-LC TaxID=3153301 RepID=UPI0032647A7F
MPITQESVVINHDEIKSFKGRDAKIKREAARLEADQRSVAKRLLKILYDFVKENPELYEIFKVETHPDEKVKVSYSNAKQAYRVQFVKWFGGDASEYVYMIPKLLLDDKEAYKVYREQYLKEVRVKEKEKHDNYLALRSAKELFNLYGSNEALIANGFQGVVDIFEKNKSVTLNF